MTACNMTKKDAQDSHLAGSWGRFARKLHLYSRNRQEENQALSETVWLYVAISVVYFFLIGMVLTILLLAPKFRPTVHEIPKGPIGDIRRETVPPPELALANESEDHPMTASKASFLAEPRDPLYDIDIDPRSPIFRGDAQEWQVDDGRKLRINSKFLQD